MPTLFERIIPVRFRQCRHRDDRVIAFRDIRPRAPTHILVVPNKSIPTANDIEDGDEALVATSSPSRAILRRRKASPRAAIA